MKARILVWLVALFCCHNALFAQKEFVNASARLSGHPRILLPVSYTQLTLPTT